MYKDYRINTKINAGDKVLKVNLKQGIDTFKILSLEINPEDEYVKHTSDYGMIVGRVLANNSFGVPNVKVSVFVPVSDEDEEKDSIEQVYPYKTVNSQNTDGIKYNLLSDDDYAGVDGLHKSIGTFPNKSEILDNDEECEIFDKYWQYTTVTNEAGDYMIPNVPTGSCQVHYDCDLSDIGLISQRPYDLINKGYDVNLFKSAVEFKDTDNPATAVYIISQNATVFVYPFWGDDDANQIGITRHDINLDYEFEPTCIFMGSSMTDSPGTYFDVTGVPVGANGRFKSLVTSRGNIEMIRYTEDGTIEQVTGNTTNIIDENGVWCYQIPMNLDRIYTDEEGNIKATKIPGKGIPTRARVRFRISLTNVDDDANGEHTAKILVPCNPKIGGTSHYIHRDTSDVSESDWKNYYEFGSNTPNCAFRDLMWGKVYSVKQYYPRIEYDLSISEKVEGFSVYNVHYRSNTSDSSVDYSDYPLRFGYPFSCISSIDDSATQNPFPYTTMYAGAENLYDDGTYYWFRNHLSEMAADSSYSNAGLHFCFENDWVNGCLYFPKMKIIKDQDGYRYYGSKSGTTTDYYSYLYYTGRHNCRIVGKTLSTRETSTGKSYTFKWDITSTGSTIVDQDNTSIFSHVPLYDGLLEKKTNSLGQNIFYYRCGVSSKKSWEYDIMYAADIILLGNLVDIYDSLPPLYKNLPSTTATFPPMVPPRTFTEAGMNMNGYTEQLAVMWWTDGGTDTDDVDIFGNYTDFNSDYPSEAYDETASKSHHTEDWTHKDMYSGSTESKALWYQAVRDCPLRDDGMVNSFVAMRYTQERMTVFFGLKCNGCQDFLHYMVPSFVNTSRICELDVTNDHAIKNSYGDIISTNGLIDKNDIIENANRSAFASMNYDITKTYQIYNTGYNNFCPTPLYLADFDGRLQLYLQSRPNPDVTEERDTSYVEFRYGRQYPLSYADDGAYKFGITHHVSGGWWLWSYSYNYTNWYEKIENHGPLPLPANSLYFYFGLRAGASAIDKFNDTYGMPTNDSVVDKTSFATITINPDNYYCKDNETYRSVEIELSTSLIRPLTVIITSNGTAVYSQEYPNSTLYPAPIYLSLPVGIYILNVTDGNGETHSKRFVISDNVLTIEYDAKHDGGNDSVIFNTIETKLSVYTLTKDSDTQIHYTNYNTGYYVNFDKEIFNIKDKTIYFSGNTDVISATIWKQEGTRACSKSIINIQFKDKASHTPMFCGISTNYLRPWVAKTKLAWDSKNTMDSGNADDRYYFMTDTSDSAYYDQLSVIAAMVGCVCDNKQMSISYDDSDFTPSVIYPNEPSYISYYAWDENPLQVSTTYSNISNPQLHAVSGCISLLKTMPDLIAQNFPNICDAKSKFRSSDIYQYTDNPFFNFKYSSGTQETVNNNYFGFYYDDDSNKDLPNGTISPKINEYIAGAWESSSIQNMFSIKTLDKRFDYDIMISTPTILPSGYDNFTGLIDKTIVNGKIEAKIYGGLRLDYDDDLKLTSYCLNSVLKKISGSPSSNASLYLEAVYEDSLDKSITHGIYYPDNLIRTVNSINKFNLNDQITITGNLSGRTGFIMSLAGCSSDFNDGIVSQGKSFDEGITYQAGISLIHDSSSSDSYDILYEAVSGISGEAVYPSLDGSSLAFTTNGDSMYGGNVYSDISLDSSNSYDSRYTNFAQYNGLHLVFHENSSDSGTTYELTRSELATISSYTSASYDTSVSYYPTYQTTGGMRTNANDDESCFMYQFSLDASKIAEQPKEKRAMDGYFTIPIRKRYTGTDGTLMNQAYVINNGYAYYGGCITINYTTAKDIYTIQLSSPLIGTDGKIDYSKTNLVLNSGRLHCLGEMYEYHTDNGSVAYDSNMALFTIRLTDTTKAPILYFTMTNGMKYKIIMK